MFRRHKKNRRLVSLVCIVCLGFLFHALCYHPAFNWAQFSAKVIAWTDVAKAPGGEPYELPHVDSIGLNGMQVFMEKGNQQTSHSRSEHGSLRADSEVENVDPDIKQPTLAPVIKAPAVSSPWDSGNLEGFHSVAEDTEDLKLFVGVLSSAKNADRRAAVRETWGSDVRLHAVKFFISMDKASSMLVQDEISRHDDVVLIHHENEEYYKLTAKTIELMNIAAFASRFVGYTHVVKVDDDTLLRITRLREVLGMHSRESTAFGYVEAPVLPHRSGQFGMTYDEWPRGKMFPTWIHGPCYVLTIDLVKWLAGSMDVDAKIKLEDISISNWLFMRGNVTFVHSPQFNYWLQHE